MSSGPQEQPPRPHTYRPSPIRALLEALLVTVPALVLLVWVSGGPHPAVLVPVLLVGALMFLHGASTRVSATADRLSVRELWYHRTVDLDDLTMVEVRPSGPKLRLRLCDGNGRTIRTRLDLVRADPAIWELVSAAVAGARFDTWRHDPVTASWFENPRDGSADPGGQL